jgi:hypothetical protein
MPDSPIQAMHGLLRTGQLDKKGRTIGIVLNNSTFLL